MSEVLKKEELRLISFGRALSQIKIKSEEFRSDGSEKKADIASKFYTDMLALFDTYLLSPGSSEEYNQFKTQSDTLIKNAQESELKDHRGWKGLLTNILIGVLTLGTAFIANAIYSKGEHTFFEVRTDSLNKIHEIKTSLESIGNNDCEKPEGDESSINTSPG